MACALVGDARSAADASRRASASDRISYAYREAYVAHGREQRALLSRDATAHVRAVGDVDKALADAGPSTAALRADHVTYRRFAGQVFADAASGDVARALSAYVGN